MSNPWSSEDSETVRRLYPSTATIEIAKLVGRTESSVYQHAAKLGVMKTKEYLASTAGRIGLAGFGEKARFRRGLAPWNKGIEFHAGGMAKQTQFKKGGKPKTTKPIGSVRFSKEGIRFVKVSDTGVRRDNWKAASVIEWEKHNGLLPEGMIVIFKDSNRKNESIENLDAVTRQELMKRNSYHNYPKEIATLIQLRGVLNRKINQRAEA